MIVNIVHKALKNLKEKNLPIDLIKYKKYAKRGDTEKNRNRYDLLFKMSSEEHQWSEINYCCPKVPYIGRYPNSITETSHYDIFITTYQIKAIKKAALVVFWLDINRENCTVLIFQNFLVKCEVNEWIRVNDHHKHTKTLYSVRIEWNIFLLD